MDNERTYLHQSKEYNIFIHNTRVYFECYSTHEVKQRTILISMNINDVSLKHHSGNQDTIPVPVHNQMLDICAGLRLTRKQLIQNDLRERKVQLARISNSCVEYALGVVDSEKGDCVHYDFYMVHLEGATWRLGAPHYWSQYLKTKRQRGVFKAYFTPKGEAYFNVDKKRINLSEFTKLF
jgi:hypothetical protein